MEKLGKLVFFSLLVGIFLLNAGSFFTNANAGAKFSKAPSFTLMGDDGKKHSLKDFKNKIVVLEWFNEECPFVKKHYESENMQNLQKKYVDQGIIWLTINSSAEGKQGHIKDAKEASEVKMRQKMGSSYLLLDPKGTVGKAYEAKTTPHMYIINKVGNLVYQGAIDSIASYEKEDILKSKNYVSMTLDDLLNNLKIKSSSTKSYGCSVKY